MLSTGAERLTLTLADEPSTRRLAVDLTTVLQPGDTVTLSGDLGAGKSTLARALIRHIADDARLEVPSPTFTLVQSYALRIPIVHADLYRVSDLSELAELGIDEAGSGAIVLIEWPDRAAEALPADRVDVALGLVPGRGANAREAVITGHGALARTVARLRALRGFLDLAGVAEAERRHMQGDASSRSYERLASGERSLILMNAPRRPDGPPVRNGLPYSAIAHLAEDVKPFVAMGRALRERGFAAPQIHAADLEEGFLLLEDLGTECVVAGDPPAPIEERYAAAVDVLARLHQETLPRVLPVAPNVDYTLPPYDLDALLIEIELLPDWYVPHRDGNLSQEARAEFLGLWRAALARALEAPPTWVLRDYHSPNLIWLPERDGVQQVGIIDFQDAMMGPAAYDVVSLLQDARVDVPSSMEIALLGRYAKARLTADPSFVPADFAELYVVLGAQRATKILGIFARLDQRDGKPQYLRHLPRIWRYLRRSLQHHSLAGLRDWYDTHVPAPPEPHEAP